MDPALAAEVPIRAAHPRASRARAALPGAAAAPGRAHAPFDRAARRTHRAQRPALRHNHGRAGPSPDAPLRGRLRAP